MSLDGLLRTVRPHVSRTRPRPYRRRSGGERSRESLRRRLSQTLDVIVARDPSVRSRSEALLHPTVLTLAGHRMGNHLYRHRRYRSARLVCMVTKVLSGGIEIHPGARIGRRFFIDHGAGAVIGETAVIGDDVSLFHQVTLGSTGWWHDRARDGGGRGGGRRHPRLGNGVTVGAGATLLGPITIGDDALIGAMSLVTSDVPKGGRVRADAARAHEVTDRGRGGER